MANLKTLTIGDVSMNTPSTKAEILNLLGMQETCAKVYDTKGNPYYRTVLAQQETVFEKIGEIKLANVSSDHFESADLPANAFVFPSSGRLHVATTVSVWTGNDFRAAEFGQRVDFVVVANYGIVSTPLVRNGVSLTIEFLYGSNGEVETVKFKVDAEGDRVSISPVYITNLCECYTPPFFTVTFYNGFSGSTDIFMQKRFYAGDIDLFAPKYIPNNPFDGWEFHDNGQVLDKFGEPLVWRSGMSIQDLVGDGSYGLYYGASFDAYWFI